MKYLAILSLLCFSSIYLDAQNEAVGTWMAIDDKDGQPSSHIEIYEVEGKLHGKITKILKESDVEGEILCEKCKGDKKDQPIVGMEIIWKMKPHKENEWKGGKIMDPESGKEYKCKIKLNKEDILEVRGYMGFSLIGRTQKWHRVNGEESIQSSNQR